MELGMSYGESLAFSIAQIATPCFAAAHDFNMRGLFSALPCLWFPDGTDRILAEPSNNSNLRAARQLFAAIFD